MRISLIILSLLSFSPFSHADGNSLLSDCKGSLDMLDGKSTNGSSLSAGICMGTIQGMRHMNSFYESKLSKEDTFFCVPEKAQAGQLIRVVVKYLEDNPSELHQHEAILIALAFSSSYSCV